MIEIQNLSKRFGDLVAVDDVSFTVRPGEVLGFLGPNGAGKSTTMKMVTGFLAPSGGRVAVCGHDVAKEPLEAKRCLGYLPEGAPLYPDMTPASFLDFVAAVRGLDGQQRKERIAEVVRKVHLEGVMHQRLETLSKGFKRRVGLAQAILHDPRVLVLDEPTDGLDPNQKRDVRALIREMAKDKVIVLSTHILEEVEAVCTRAIIIAHGRILFDGTPQELQRRSRTHNSIHVTVEGDVEVTVRMLGELEGVRDVEVLSGANGACRLRVLPREGANLVHAVSELALRESVAVEELYVERGGLDEVFRDITQGAQAAR